MDHEQDLNSKQNNNLKIQEMTLTANDKNNIHINNSEDYINFLNHIPKAGKSRSLCLLEKPNHYGNLNNLNNNINNNNHKHIIIDSGEKVLNSDILPFHSRDEIIDVNKLKSFKSQKSKSSVSSWNNYKKTRYKQRSILLNYEPEGHLKRTYYRELKIKNHEKSKQIVSKRKFEMIFKFIFYFISNVMNVLSVINYIIQTYYENEPNPESEYILNVLQIIEISFSAYFFCEYFLFLIRNKENISKYILSLDTLIDLVTILPPIIFFLFSNNLFRIQFFRVLRIFRVFRILRIYKSLRMIQIENSIVDAEDDHNPRLNPIKLQFISILVILFCNFFIFAGLILGLNGLIENAFNKTNMNFFDALYFTIVTSSTLGYGDIIPTHPLTRMLIIASLFLLVLIVSNQVSKLSILLRTWGPSSVQYNFKKHIIVILNLTINYIVVLSILQKKYKDNQIVIITNNTLNLSSPFIKLSKIKVIQVLEYDIEAFDRANTKDAQAILIFTEKVTYNFESQEKIMDFLILKLNRFYSEIPIYLQTLFSERSSFTTNQKMIRFKKIVPIMKLKSLMLSKSLFNPGFSCFIQNLIFNDHNPPDDIEDFNPLMKNYFLGTENKICVEKFPNYFHNMQFSEAVYIIYLKSIIDHFTKLQTSNRNSNRAILLIGITEITKYNIYEKEDVKIFPGRYIIKPKSYGIFISYTKDNYIEKFFKNFSNPEVSFNDPNNPLSERLYIRSKKDELNVVKNQKNHQGQASDSKKPYEILKATLIDTNQNKVNTCHYIQNKPLINLKPKEDEFLLKMHRNSLNESLHTDYKNLNSMKNSGSDASEKIIKNEYKIQDFKKNNMLVRKVSKINIIRPDSSSKINDQDYKNTNKEHLNLIASFLDKFSKNKIHSKSENSKEKGLNKLKRNSSISNEHHNNGKLKKGQKHKFNDLKKNYKSNFEAQEDVSYKENSPNNVSYAKKKTSNTIIMKKVDFKNFILPIGKERRKSMFSKPSDLLLLRENIMEDNSKMSKNNLNMNKNFNKSYTTNLNYIESSENLHTISDPKYYSNITKVNKKLSHEGDSKNTNGYSVTQFFEDSILFNSHYSSSCSSSISSEDFKSKQENSLLNKKDYNKYKSPELNRKIKFIRKQTENNSNKGKNRFEIIRISHIEPFYKDKNLARKNETEKHYEKHKLLLENQLKLINPLMEKMQSEDIEYNTNKESFSSSNDYVVKSFRNEIKIKNNIHVNFNKNINEQMNNSNKNLKSKDGNSTIRKKKLSRSPNLKKNKNKIKYKNLVLHRENHISERKHQIHRKIYKEDEIKQNNLKDDVSSKNKNMNKTLSLEDKEIPNQTKSVNPGGSIFYSENNILKTLKNNEIKKLNLDESISGRSILMDNDMSVIKNKKLFENVQIIDSSSSLSAELLDANVKDKNKRRIIFDKKKFLNKNTKTNLEFLDQFEDKCGEKLVEEIQQKCSEHYSKINNLVYKFNEKELNYQHRIFDLAKINVQEIFLNHILIIGFQDAVERLVGLITYHFPKKSICFLAPEVKKSIICDKILKQYQNTYYLQGNPINPFDLLNAGLNNVFHVIFLSENIFKKLNEDMNLLLSCRVVDYYFNINAILELWDSKNSNLLGYIPLDKNSKNITNEFYHPLFMAGKVLYLSHLDQLTTLSITDPIIIESVYQILSVGFRKKINKIAKKPVNNKNNNFDAPVIITIDVPEMYFGKEYCNLAEHLLSLDEPAVPLGVYVSDPLSYQMMESKGKISQGENAHIWNIINSHKRRLINFESMGKIESGYFNNMKFLRDISYTDKIVMNYTDIQRPHLPIFITNPLPSFILNKDCKILLMTNFSPKLITLNEFQDKPRRSKYFLEKELLKNVDFEEQIRHSQDRYLKSLELLNKKYAKIYINALKTAEKGKITK